MLIPLHIIQYNITHGTILIQANNKQLSQSNPNQIDWNVIRA